MDVITKYLNLFHLPFFSSADSNSKTAVQVVDTTKSLAITASKSLNSLHAPALSPGLLFGILVVVGILLLVLTLGRTRTLISVLAIYVAFALQTMFPFFGWLLKNVSFTDDLPTLRILTFFVLYIIIFSLLNRSVLKVRFNLSEASFLVVVLMGLTQFGFLVSIILNLAPSFYEISKKIPTDFLLYFSGQFALFYWALIPIVILLFQKREK